MIILLGMGVLAVTVIVVSVLLYDHLWVAAHERGSWSRH